MAYFAPYIDAAGIHMPTYEDRLEDLVSAYRTIFGVDAAMDPSVPDYQLLSVLAKALDDTSALVVAAFNSRNPNYATGHSLDLLLPQYGLVRLPDESDAEARARMTTALAGRNVSTIDSLRAALLSLERVQLVKVYVNDTNDTDERGITAHSIAVIIYGGRSAEIPVAIYNKKPPGIATWGTTTSTITDAEGNSHQIKWSRPENISINVIVNVTKLADFQNAELTDVAGPALANYANTLPIGEGLIIARLFGLCYSAVPDLASKFAVLSINVYVDGQLQSNVVNTAWNQRIACSAQTGVGFVFH